MNKKTVPAILFLFFLIHFAFIIYHSHYIISDDFTYFYMAKLVAEGYTPYRDFFFAHPPVQLAIYSLFIELFGTNLFIVNLIPLAAILISAYLIYKITSKIWTMVLFLTIFPIFHLSTIGFGLNIGLVFMLLSFYLAEKYQYAAGISMGFVMLCRLHFFPIVVSSIFLQNSLEKKSKYTIGMVIVGLILTTLFIFFPQAVDQMFFYHAFKKAIYWSEIRYFVLGIGIIGCYVSYKTRYFIPFLAFSIFLMSLKIVFAYYMIPMSALIVLALSEKSVEKLHYILIIGSLVGLSIGATILSFNEIKENKQEIIEIISTVDNLKNNLVCGNNEITPLVALKTGKMIKDNEVDTNYQRKKILDCNGSIAIYRLREFKKCKLVKEYKNYKVSLC